MVNEIHARLTTRPATAESVEIDISTPPPLSIIYIIHHPGQFCADDIEYHHCMMLKLGIKSSSIIMWAMSSRFAVFIVVGSKYIYPLQQHKMAT